MLWKMYMVRSQKHAVYIQIFRGNGKENVHRNESKIRGGKRVNINI